MPRKPEDIRMSEKNQMTNLDAFCRTWDSAGTSASEATILRSEFGNINLQGSPLSQASWNIVRSDPRFSEFLEDGIKELVLVLTDDFKWITYSSCEGHFYPDEDIPPRRRSVSIAPRSLQEAARIAGVLQFVKDTVRSEHVEFLIRAIPIVDESRHHLGIELDLLPKSGWANYFDNLHAVTTEATDTLRMVRQRLSVDSVKP